LIAVLVSIAGPALVDFCEQRRLALVKKRVRLSALIVTRLRVADIDIPDQAADAHAVPRAVELARG